MKERTLRSEGCELHYWVKQTDSYKWILFLHGAGCDHRMFERQFPAIPEDFNIVAWDARGHGRSQLDPGKRFHYQDMRTDFRRLTEHYDEGDCPDWAVNGWKPVPRPAGPISRTDKEGRSYWLHRQCPITVLFGACSIALGHTDLKADPMGIAGEIERRRLR